MFADSTRKHKRVQPAKDSCERTDGLTQLIAKEIDGLSRLEFCGRWSNNVFISGLIPDTPSSPD
jgi:hypothetical protein